MGVFFRFSWIARAGLASDMLALLALLGSSCKQSLALMAVAADTLADRFADNVLATLGRWASKERSGAAMSPHLRGQVHREVAALAKNLGELGLGNRRLSGRGLVLGTGGRRARAFLAAWVLAVDADLFWAKGGLAAVAAAADTHANGLGDSL